MNERQPVMLIYPDGLERRFASMSGAAIYTGTSYSDISSALHDAGDPHMPEALRGVQVLAWKPDKPLRPVYEWIIVKRGRSKYTMDRDLTSKIRAGEEIDCKQRHIIVVKAVSVRQAIFLAANGKEYDDRKFVGIVSIHLRDENDATIHQD